MTRVFTIVHLSDLHLYVDPDLTSTDPQLLAAARHRWRQSVLRVKKAGRLVGMDKLEVADKQAIAWLERELSEIALEVNLSEEPQPTLVVVHTGDAETIGPRPNSNGTVSYLGYDYLHAKLRDDILGVGTPWIDVYGNHDVWGGTWPLFERLAGLDAHTDNFETVRQVQGLDSYSGPLRVPSVSGLAELLIHRVNTVDPDVVGATLAWGRVGSHPIGDTEAEACSKLGAQVSSSIHQTSVQIAAMHHPPHAFPEGWWFQRWFARHLGSSRLAGADPLAAAINGKVRLVLAGHHHRANPSETASCPAPQPPLRRGATVQLAAPSPTATKHLSHLDADDSGDQARAVEAIDSRAFPVYALSITDEPSPRVIVDRIMHRQLSDTQPTGGMFGSRDSHRSAPQRVLDVELQ